MSPRGAEGLWLTRVSHLVDGGDGQVARQCGPHRLRLLHSQPPFRYRPDTDADRQKWRDQQSSRVEEDKIGGVALDDCAAVHEANGSGCAASHLVDGLWDANKIEIPGVVSKNPWKRSIESGAACLALLAVRRDTWTIRTDCDERVSQNRSHILFRHRTH